MPSTMHAACAGERRFEIRELPVPEPGPGEVRIRLEACGICGTDLHFSSDWSYAPGHTPGHEMAGVVDALGEGVAAPALGTRVAVEPLRSCGTCRECVAGRTSTCRQCQLYGVHLGGGFCEYLCIPAACAFPVIAEASAAVAALAEPLAVAVHSLRRGNLEAGQRVLVLGAGAVGLTTLIAAREAGAGEVWLSARHAQQADMAREFGAFRVLREEEATPEALATLGMQTDFDLVVETVGGHADTVRAACAAVRPSGSVSVVGVFMGQVVLDPWPLLLKEVNLHWSNCYHHPRDGRADFEDATRIIAAEHERLARLTTHQFPLERIGDAFATAADKKSGAIKVTVVHDAD